MKFLPRLFSTGYAEGGWRLTGERKDASTRRASAGPSYTFSGVPYQTNWDVNRAVRDGYEKVTLVSRGVNAIASSTSRLPIVCRKGDRDLGDIVDSRVADMLNQRTSSFEVGRYFRWRLSQQIQLSKMGAMVEVVRGRLGQPIAYHLLPPAFTRPIPDPNTFISGWEIRLPSGEVDTLFPEQVRWIKTPHPTDPYSGSTIFEALGIAVDQAFYARLYNRSFMQNDGRPGGLLAVKGDLDEDDAAELRRRFSGGPQQAGRTSVISADEVNWVDTAVTPRDAQYVQTLGLTDAELMMGMGLSKTILGDSSGTTFDNADADWEVYWRTTARDHMDLIESGFDEDTPDGMHIRHDVSSIAVLQRDLQQRLDKASADFKAGLITLDEWREIAGKEPLDVPGSRVVWIPGGLVPIGTQEDTAAAEKLTVVGPPPPPVLDPATGLPLPPESIGSGDTAPSIGSGATGHQRAQLRALPSTGTEGDYSSKVLEPDDVEPARTWL